MTTSNPLRTARERAGLTQVQLAEILGVGQPTVSEWERGDGMAMSVATYKRIAAALKLSDWRTLLPG
jgi:transcriptional regulator with XRE-family HTH domain